MASFNLIPTWPVNEARLSDASDSDEIFGRFVCLCVCVCTGAMLIIVWFCVGQTQIVELL